MIDDDNEEDDENHHHQHHHDDGGGDEACFAPLSLKVFVDLRFPKEVFVLFWGRLHSDQGTGDDVESLVDFTHPASANPVL